jgi:DNA-binding CsgD family transcriptional regulator
MGADVSAIAVHYYDLGYGRLPIVAGIDPVQARSYEQQYSRLNIWFQHEACFRDPGAVWVGQHIVGDQQVLDSPFYHDWLKPQDLFHHLFGVLERQKNTTVCLMLARSGRKGPFTQEEAGRLKVVLPVLAAAWRMERLARARAGQLGAVSSVLDHLVIGIALVGERGRVLGLNGRAAEILNGTEALNVVAGYLTCSQARHNLRLKTILDEVLTTPAGRSPEGTKALAIARTECGSPLQLVFARLADGNACQGHGRPLAAVFLFDPESIALPKQEWLADLYGLNRVEADIATLLCGGATLEEIAQRLHLSVHTVRAYLKAIFLKMGVTRQTAMVRQLLAGPAQLCVLARNTADSDAITGAASGARKGQDRAVAKSIDGFKVLHK